MAGDLGGGGGGLAGLEVDDVDPALGVLLDPVHGAPDAYRVLARLQRHVEVVLGGDRLAAAVHHVPAQEALQRGARLGVLLPGLPGRVEGERVPDRVEPLHQHVEVGRGAAGDDLVGQYVDDVAEALRGGRRVVGLHLPAQEPLERAGVDELVERAAGERDGLVPGRAAGRRSGSARTAPTSGRDGPTGTRAGPRRRSARPAGRGGRRRPRAAPVRRPGRPWWRAARRRARRPRAGGAGGCVTSWARRRVRPGTGTAGRRRRRRALTAVTTRRVRWRGWRRRRTAGVPRPAARRAASGSARPSRPIRSASSSEPRRRRSGQSPSCTPATTTSRHSRPLERCAVISRTASGRAARRVRVSAAMSWASSSSRKLSAPRPPVRSSARRRGLEQRADRVEVAVGVAARRAAAQGGALQPARPRRAVPQLPQRLLRGAAAASSSRALAQQRAEAAGAAGVRPVVRDQPFRARRAAAGQQDVGRRRHGRCRRPAPPRAAPGPGAAGRPRPCRRGARRAGSGRSRCRSQESPGCGVVLGFAGPQRARARVRSGRRPDRRRGPGARRGPRRAPRFRRLRPAPGIRPLRRLRALTSSAQRPARSGPQGQQQRGHRRLLAQRQVVAVDLQRHARRRSGPGAARGSCGRRPVTSTAISRHGTPSSRWARRSRSAMLSSLGARRRIGVAPRPGRPPPGAATGSRCARTVAAGSRVSGIRRASSRVAASSRPPERRETRSTSTGAGRAVRAREGVREVEDAVDVGAAERVDRLVGVAEGDQGPAAARASARSSRTWAGSVSWYSSTNTASYCVRSGRPRDARRAAPPGAPAPRSPARPGGRGRRGTRRGTRRPPPSRAGRCAGRRRPARRGRGPVHGCGPAPRGPRRRSRAWSGRPAGRRASGPARSPVLRQVDLAGQQLAYRHVLLGAGQQPQRLGRTGRRPGGRGPGRSRRSGRWWPAGPPGGAEPGRHPVAQLDGGLAADR